MANVRRQQAKQTKFVQTHVQILQASSQQVCVFACLCGRTGLLQPSCVAMRLYAAQGKSIIKLARYRLAIDLLKNVA